MLIFLWFPAVKATGPFDTALHDLHRNTSLALDKDMNDLPDVENDGISILTETAVSLDSDWLQGIDDTSTIRDESSPPAYKE
jgi:hypothetical protein